MFTVDLHCDSLSSVSSDRGLINAYNQSRRNPQLQVFAACIPRADQSAEERRRRVMHCLNVYIAETKRLGIVNLAGCHDLNFAMEFDRSCSIFALEGGGGLFADSEELEVLYKMGMRILSLAWDGNELSGSSLDEDQKGLTPEGREMVKRCSELGIILDVSHVSDRAFDEMCELTAYPLIATHSNFRELCGSPRNLTRAQAQKIAKRGGVIGVTLYPGYLTDNRESTVEDLFRHIDYGLELLGEDCLCFGFDIDGTTSRYPLGIDEGDSIHDRITDLLLTRYGESLTKKIASENAISFFKNNL